MSSRRKRRVSSDARDDDDVEPVVEGVEALCVS
jgi:hypothetical protein